MKRILSICLLLAFVLSLSACGGTNDTADDSIAQTLKQLEEQMGTLEKRLDEMESAFATQTPAPQENEAAPQSSTEAFDEAAARGVWVYDIPKSNNFLELTFLGEQQLRILQAVYDGGIGDKLKGTFTASGNTYTWNLEIIPLIPEDSFPPKTTVVEMKMVGENLVLTFVSGDRILFGFEKPGDVATFVRSIPAT